MSENTPAPEVEAQNISVSVTLMDSGQQLQHVFIGLEPALLIQSEYHSDDDRIIFFVTGVDLSPKDLGDLADLLKEASQEPGLIQSYEDARAEQEAENAVQGEVIEVTDHAGNVLTTVEDVEYISESDES